MTEEVTALVFDNGSSNTEVGIAGEEAPKTYFPSVIGTLRIKKASMMGAYRTGNEVRKYVGDMAQSVRSLLALQYPIKNGIVEDWDSMEKIWHHSFYNELRIAPVSLYLHPFLIV